MQVECCTIYNNDPYWVGSLALLRIKLFELSFENVENSFNAHLIGAMFMIESLLLLCERSTQSIHLEQCYQTFCEEIATVTYDAYKGLDSIQSCSQLPLPDTIHYI